MSYSIPTRYAGIRFRSRLEAKWAILFDAMGWKWEYEPFDLAGYVPDFAMIGWKHPTIVEVKPATTMDELRAHAGKIETSGWNGEAFLVGATPDIGEYGDEFGLVTANHQQHPEECGPGWYWGPAAIGKGYPNSYTAKEDGDHGRVCRDHCLINVEAGWTCLRCGVYSKVHHADLKAAWAQACNLTQWRG